MASDGDFVTIYRPDAFECFRLGPATRRADPDIARMWFATCLAYQYDDIAKRHFCEVNLSPTRLEEARLLWMRDTKRIDIEGDTTPDHFKQVGFLVYWLRRRMVVGFCRRGLAVEPSSEQDKFILSANETCAFMVGLRISVYFALKDVIDSVDHIGHAIQEMELEPALKFDIATLLKHKNVSPHSLYLIYRTLFYDLKKPKHVAPVLTLAKS
jgi:hypothetical protein